MICKNCNIKKICKNYDFLKEHDELTISDCSFKTTSFERNEHKADDKIINLPKHKEVKSITLEKPKEENKLVNCPSCNGLTFETDIVKCDKCGKECCSACGIDDIKTHVTDDGDVEVDPFRICNDCYYGEEDNKNNKVYDSNMSISNILNINKKGGDSK